jgi:hypothetical protein
MATVTIEGNRLRIHMSGWQALFALRREINVSLSNVRLVQAGTLTSKLPDGIRLPGTYIPGAITAGSYWWKRHGWSFWSVRHQERAIDIRLENEHFYRIVVEVAYPDATAAMIDDAIRQQPASGIV